MSTLLKPKTAAELRDLYVRQEMMPTIFCDGCGLGNVLNYTLWALDELQVDLNQVVFVSGIGCSSRLSGYVNSDGMHTTHGRALSFASGIKAANPNLTVIVFTGDGDGAGIGGNHLLHTIRRNMDLTVILVNNFIYGMTGGQSAPTTPIGGISSTTPYGNVEYAMDICALAMALEAPYVARWTVNQPYPPIKSIAQGIAKRGFALIEMLVPCPTAYGGRNGLKGVERIWQWYRDNTVLLDDFEHIMEFGTHEEQEEIKHKIKVGVLQDSERECFDEQWAKLVERVKL
ncbi:MAG: 2-oxoacid:ferredoxin oxidoreductase subunit beta [Candidatus Viridilinea halotolerans]|uniref:2-oxoacid:ferredoxin oxidoreductase subunit beta n=1 Tax=Candidatus Viridilinea halotolerans TaxID=2491704 RepID=A0A426UCD1_9CHLR|nr:MAG: 2-oxoacid:ferredoxin oxidoreductase subunit beta [Candidatus Viridilinea halotolerans]